MSQNRKSFNCWVWGADFLPTPVFILGALTVSSTFEDSRGRDPGIPPDWIGTPLPTAIRLAGGEPLGRLLEEFRPYLLTIAEHFCPQAIAPKVGRSDLVQDTLVKGYQGFPSFAGRTREELAAWLRRILMNHLGNTVEAFHAGCRDVRREERCVPPVIDQKEQSASQILAGCENRVRLDEALARLPEQDRQVLLLRHRDTLSFSELGRTFNLSETGARKLWARAIRALRQQLDTESAHHPP